MFKFDSYVVRLLHRAAVANIKTNKPLKYVHSTNGAVHADRRQSITKWSPEVDAYNNLNSYCLFRVSYLAGHLFLGEFFR